MESPYKGISGPKRLVAATRNTLAGLAEVMRHEASFRLELAVAMLAFPAALWLGNSGAEQALLAGSVLMVLVVELINSAIEAAVDRVSLDHHPLAKRAKDIGSAAVAAAILTAAVIWLLVLLGR